MCKYLFGLSATLFLIGTGLGSEPIGLIGKAPNRNLGALTKPANGPAIRSGRALNALLRRFAAIPLGPGDAKTFQLNNNEVEHLRFRQAGKFGLEFRAALPMRILEVCWRGSLKDAAFGKLREAFSAARDQAIKALRQENLAQPARQRLEQSVEALDVELSRQKPPVQKQRAYLRYLRARNCLRKLSRQVHRLLQVGALPREVLCFQGKDVPALVTHMLRHGLQFAPAFPDDEAAYHAVYSAMWTLFQKKTGAAVRIGGNQAPIGRVQRSASQR